MGESSYSMISVRFAWNFCFKIEHLLSKLKTSKIFVGFYYDFLFCVLFLVVKVLILIFPWVYKLLIYINSRHYYTSKPITPSLFHHKKLFIARVFECFNVVSWTSLLVKLNLCFSLMIFRIILKTVLYHLF